jgi:hypothetical protein
VQKQVGTLVRREAAGEADQQYVGVKEVFERSKLVRRVPMSRALEQNTAPDVLHKAAFL